MNDRLRPTSRRLLALHVGCGLPLIALAIWFGLIDRLPFGEGRCASCGLEGYAIALHVLAGVWLGGMVIAISAVRREAREGIAAPGDVTVRTLAAVTLFVLVSLIWHSLFLFPALGAMIASLALFPAAAIWWILSAVTWWRRPPSTEGQLSRRLTGALAGAWVSLVLLLPAMLGWVWADRVNWLVF